MALSASGASQIRAIPSAPPVATRRPVRTEVWRCTPDRRMREHRRGARSRDPRRARRVVACADRLVAVRAEPAPPRRSRGARAAPVRGHRRRRGPARTVPSYIGTMSRLAVRCERPRRWGSSTAALASSTRFAPAGQVPHGDDRRPPRRSRRVRPSGDRLAPNAHPLCAFSAANGVAARGVPHLHHAVTARRGDRARRRCSTSSEVTQSRWAGHAARARDVSVAWRSTFSRLRGVTPVQRPQRQGEAQARVAVEEAWSPGRPARERPAMSRWRSASLPW